MHPQHPQQVPVGPNHRRQVPQHDRVPGLLVGLPLMDELWSSVTLDLKNTRSYQGQVNGLVSHVMSKRVKWSLIAVSQF